MQFARRSIAVTVTLALPVLWQSAIAQGSATLPEMDGIVVRAPRISDRQSFEGSRLDAASVIPYRGAHLSATIAGWICYIPDQHADPLQSSLHPPTLAGSFLAGLQPRHQPGKQPWRFRSMTEV